MREDVDENQLRPGSRATLSAFKQAAVRMPFLGGTDIGNPAWLNAIFAYTKDHDRAKLRQAFIDTPPPIDKPPAMAP